MRMGNARVMVPGDAVAFASAIVFATGITLVALIYQDGANVHAVNLSRVLVFATVMAFTLGIRRISPVATTMSTHPAMNSANNGFISTQLRWHGLAHTQVARPETGLASC